MKSFSVFFIVCFLCLSMPAAAGSARTVRIQLKWVHQAQFAGCYAALEKQFYKNLGLDVALIEGGPGKNQTQALLDGKADFCISSPEDLLMHRSRDEPVSAVAAIYRKSAVVFLSKTGSGIQKPGDFAGKVIAAESNQGISDFRLQFDALMENLGVDRGTMTLVPYDTEYKGFISGQTDITPAYFTGGLIKLRAMGLKVNIIYPGDYRVRFYSDILMTTHKRIQEDPDLVQDVVLATMKGWKYAIDHIDESVPMIMKHARIKDAGLQRNMLEAAVPLINTGTDRLGWMTLAEWQHMYKILLDQDILTAPVAELERVFTNRFLEKLASGGHQ
jgi:NitT/TauT family transport system substrate-binding protein